MTNLFVEDILSASDKPFRVRAREAYERHREEQLAAQVQELREALFGFLSDDLGLTAAELQSVEYEEEITDTRVSIHAQLPGHFKLRSYHVFESSPGEDSKTVTKFEMEDIPGIWMPVKSLIDVGRQIRL